jgi:glutamate:GABA antiporter
MEENEMRPDITGSERRAATKSEKTSGKSVRIIGTASIAGISLAAVLTLRGFPSVAEYGWASIGLYVFGAIFFLIPLALVCAELGTGWPKAGGLYAWVRQGFGAKSGFLAVWFEWIEGIVWFPTVLAFVAATIAYIFASRLSNNKVYLVLVMLAVFWGMTLINFLGLKRASLLNNIGVVIGTLLPAAVLIALGVYWLAAGKHIAIAFSFGKLLPNFGSIDNLVFFVGVLLGYAGIELFGFHAKETKDPQHTYPKAIILSALLIVAVSILATLSIAFVVPDAKLSLVAGLLQAFAVFFKILGLPPVVTQIMAALTALGTLALISVWLLGPSKGLYAAERTGDLPPVLHGVNRRHIPVAVLVAQGILGTLFALLFLFVPSINASYWMLSALTTQILVLMYIMILAAGIRLRYTEPNTPRPFKVPGGNAGMWFVAGIGIFGCVLGLVLGFFPPTGVATWPTPIYVLAMFIAIVICSVPPFIIERIKKPNWFIAHPDPVLLDVDEFGDEIGREAAGASTASLPQPVSGSATTAAHAAGLR